MLLHRPPVLEYGPGANEFISNALRFSAASEPNSGQHNNPQFRTPNHMQLSGASNLQVLFLGLFLRCSALCLAPRE